MAEWKEYNLEDVSEILCGATPSTTVSKYWNNDIKWVTAKDVSQSNGYKIFDTERKISKLGFDNCSCEMLPINTTVLIARGATMGRSCMVGEEMALNQTCYALIAKRKEIHPYFLFYLIKSLTTHFTNISHGAIFDTVVGSSLRETKVVIPCLDEQELIASTLRGFDDKIDLLHRQNKTLEALAETLFRQWFVDEATEGWTIGKLGDVLELVYGKALKEEVRTGQGFPVVGSSGVVGYHSDFLIEGPGIVIGRKGTLGKVIYLFENFFPIDTTYFVKSKVNSVGLFYEYFLLKTMNFGEMNSDSAVPGLNRDIALLTEIKIAPFEKLKQYNEYCSTLFEKLKQNHIHISTLIKLRETLLPKLMSGEIKINL